MVKEKVDKKVERKDRKIHRVKSYRETSKVALFYFYPIFLLIELWKQITNFIIYVKTNRYTSSRTLKYTTYEQDLTGLR